MESNRPDILSPEARLEHMMVALARARRFAVYLGDDPAARRLQQHADEVQAEAATLETDVGRKP